MQELQNRDQQSEAVQLPRDEEKGAIGWAFLVWLLGGGLGFAIVVFIILKIVS